MSGRALRMSAVLALIGLSSSAKFAPAQSLLQPLLPEARDIRVRDPSLLPRARLPDVPPPPTVAREDLDEQLRNLTLDDALRTALANAGVVRVLAGLSATTSGRTVYDVAITDTTIDDEQAPFDPVLEINNNWDRIETPSAVLDPNDPSRAMLEGLRTDDYRFDASLSKLNLLGGKWALAATTDPTRSRFSGNVPVTFPLKPESHPALELSYVQPLLQGGGVATNRAPIVVARIDTERSYFQLKDSLQDLVRSVIEVYWSLVAARMEVWIRQRQVEQADYAFRRADAEFRTQRRSAADRRQALATLSNLRADLLEARASVLQREAALRDLLGLPPAGGPVLVPVTPPSEARLEWEWESLVAVAQERRPDLVELKLIIEADQQFLVQANNLALPRLDAVALYRWDGIQGRTPGGERISSGFDDFSDWTLGVNFSVPLGLRAGRASLRRQELVLVRDRANLDQGVHAAIHALATSVRTLDRLYEQYLAHTEARQANYDNLRQQQALYATGTGLLLNVLTAINDWGNSVFAQVNALTLYNTQLAVLEQETGTILESHGIVMQEERFRHVGPLGHWHPAWYPARTPPSPNAERYEGGDRPAEESFDLTVPAPAPPRLRRRPRDDEPSEELPAPAAPDRTSELRLLLPEP
jgi:outer membrane protein TolC